MMTLITLTFPPNTTQPQYSREADNSDPSVSRDVLVKFIHLRDEAVLLRGPDRGATALDPELNTQAQSLTHP